MCTGSISDVYEIVDIYISVINSIRISHWFGVSIIKATEHRHRINPRKKANTENLHFVSLSLLRLLRNLL